jgi:hypothetical protein
MIRRYFFQILALIEFVAIIYLGYWISQTAKSRENQFAPNGQIQFGKCIKDPPKLPSGLPDTSYVRVEITLAGSNLQLRRCEWNNLEYTSATNCFTINSDNSLIKMVNYIPRDKTDTTAYLNTLIRTDSNGSSYEFSTKVFNMNGKLIGKYPLDAESVKGIIPSIKTPVVLFQNIRLDK